MKITRFLITCLCALLLPLAQVFAALIDNTTPDATLRGSHLVASGEYHFPPTIDLEVFPGNERGVYAT